jgi:hypothetical protein
VAATDVVGKDIASATARAPQNALRVAGWMAKPQTMCWGRPGFFLSIIDMSGETFRSSKFTAPENLPL